jgi:tetratricopeptide (TPR) repeat protein
MVVILQQHGYKHLAWLVGHEVHPGQGLLVAAVQFFFQRAIESDEELMATLQLARLDKLSETQASSFLQIEVLLEEHSEKLEALLSGLLSVTLDTHDAVLDIYEEQRRLGDRLDDMYQMLGQLLEQTRLNHRRDVRPTDTRSIRGPQERRRVQELVNRYEALPECERQRRPALLNSVALLQVAAGQTQAAQQRFEELAAIFADDPQVSAQACYNAYQAALARRDYDVALDPLCEAVRLDPQRFAPFPFGDFEPERILGAGGFGVAIKCLHATLRRPLVVKVLWTEGLDRAVEDIFREAQVLSDLDHPAIIHLRDCRFADSEHKRPYLVMDYFESLNLTEYVRGNGPLPPTDLLPIARSVAEALESAHGQGILHRDIKPDNLLIRRELNGSWRVKLIDFGLAVKQETMLATVSTADSPDEYTIAGTIDYAAPEQMGRLPGVNVGPYSDVYAFARTCYYALLGTPIPDDAERDTLPDRWRRLLSQCTARKIENRVRDFGVVLSLLHEMEQPPLRVATVPPPVEQRTPARKRLAPPRYIETPPGPAPKPRVSFLPPVWFDLG